MRLKQWLAVFLVVVMVTTTTAWAAPAQEEYVTRGEAVEMLLTAADDYRPDAQKSDIIKGYGDGQLHEEQPVTRAEALIMLTRAFGEFPELREIICGGRSPERILPTSRNGRKRSWSLHWKRGSWRGPRRGNFPRMNP